MGNHNKKDAIYNDKGKLPSIFTFRQQIIENLRPDLEQLNSIFAASPIQQDRLQKLLQNCWNKDPDIRPIASEVDVQLNTIMEGLIGDKLSDGRILTTKEDIASLAVGTSGTLETPKMPPSETDKVSAIDREELLKCATRESMARDEAQTSLSTTSRMTPSFMLHNQQLPGRPSHNRRGSCILPPLRQQSPQLITSSSKTLPGHRNRGSMIISVESREAGVVFRRVQSPPLVQLQSLPPALPPSLPK